MKQTAKISSGKIVSMCIIIVILLSLFGAAGCSDGDDTNNVACDGTSYSRLRTWGAETEGQEPMWFYEMTGIAFYNGYIYVADSMNHRIQRFDNNTWIEWGEYEYIPMLPYEFSNPVDIDVDGQGNVYVADMMDRVKIYNGDGVFINQYTAYGGQPQNSGHTRALAVNSSGEVYVLNDFSDRVLKFDTSGNQIHQWGSYGTSGGGFFNDPQGIAVDSIGYVYVADTGNCRVQKFDSGGNFEGWWGKNDLGEIRWHTTGSNRSPSCGTEDGAMYYPTGICVDEGQHVYITDRNNNRIQKYSAWGQYITKWGTQGSGNNQLDTPWGITIDNDLCHIYIADQNNNRVVVLDAQ